MGKHKVFISYHRADTKQEEILEKILNDNNIEFYSVPKDANFDNWSQEHIAQVICDNMKDCDILICLIGKETYSRPNVDREIHEALKGKPGVRKGIIALLIENRNDSKFNINKKTFPAKLLQNKDYVVIEQFGSFKSNALRWINKAYDNSINSTIQTTHANNVMPLRLTKYFDRKL